MGDSDLMEDASPLAVEPLWRSADGLETIWKVLRGSRVCRSDFRSLRDSSEAFGVENKTWWVNWNVRRIHRESVLILALPRVQIMNCPEYVQIQILRKLWWENAVEFRKKKRMLQGI